MASLSGKSKFDRVADLIRWGINAPAYIRIPYGSKLEGGWLLDHICHIAEPLGWDRVSLRFEGDVGGRTGVFINQTIRELYERRHELYEQYFDLHNTIIISQGMPIADWSGCLVVDENFSFILELIADRPVRDLTHSRAVPDLRLSGNLLSEHYPTSIQEELTSVASILDEARRGPAIPIYYEVSYFDYPLGALNRRVLFWEYEEMNYGQPYAEGRSFYPSVWGNPSTNFLGANAAP